jgi:alpha-amylase
MDIPNSQQLSRTVYSTAHLITAALLAVAMTACSKGATNNPAPEPGSSHDCSPPNSPATPSDPTASGTPVAVATPCATPSAGLTAALPAKIDDGVVLDAWMWKFSDVQGQLGNIQAAGYNAVKLSPITPTKTSSATMAWYLFYQPVDLTVGNAQLGSEANFQALCTAANAKGIHIIVDAVLNQTADNGSVGQFDPNVAGYIQANKATWFHADTTSVSDYTNRQDETQECLGNGPDWATQNTTVQSIMLGFLNQSIADGASAFRFDAAKSIETSQGADANTSWNGVQSAPVTLYHWDATNHTLTSTPYPTTGSGNFWDDVLPNLTNRSSLFLYGEVIEDSTSGGTADNEQGYQTYYRTTATNVLGQLSNAVDNKNLTGLASISNDGRTLDPTKLVVYAENWDDYAGNPPLYATAGFSYSKRLLENVLLTARAAMVNIVFVRPGEGLWYDPVMVAVNRFRNAMAGTSEFLVYSGSSGAVNMPAAVLAIKRQRSGTDEGMVIVNAGASSSIALATSLPNGTYADRGPSGASFLVSGGTLSGTMPATTAVVLTQ